MLCNRKHSMGKLASDLLWSELVTSILPTLFIHFLCVRLGECRSIPQHSRLCFEILLFPVMFHCNFTFTSIPSQQKAQVLTISEIASCLFEVLSTRKRPWQTPEIPVCWWMFHNPKKDKTLLALTSHIFSWHYTTWLNSPRSFTLTVLGHVQITEMNILLL